ncbi:hypothetical protein [Paraburkholderia ferrariae]|uniref:hypothetical protein n=1 Tax=Paraburkholderia ferrariae TaxID=386056 RepID=UPI00047F993B|nr:hypothetical protein [Paraburkholderia ferrariae]
MKHAGPDALKQLESLLDRLRELPGLSERSTGIFYRKSKPFLHFHEDPTGLYADVRIEVEFERFPVNSEGEKSALLKAIARVIAPA